MELPSLISRTSPFQILAVSGGIIQVLFFKPLIEHLDWPQSLKQFFINVSYYILVASLTLMAL